MVPPRDPAALAGAIRRLLQDERLRRTLGEAGRIRAGTDYTPEAYRRTLVALYQELLDERNLGPAARYWWLSMLHVFYTWAIDEEYLEVDPTAKIRRPKLTPNLPRPMPEDDLTRAINAADPILIGHLVFLTVLVVRPRGLFRSSVLA